MCECRKVKSAAFLAGWGGREGRKTEEEARREESRTAIGRGERRCKDQMLKGHGRTDVRCITLECNTAKEAQIMGSCDTTGTAKK